jgi:hypothetical protein
LLKAQNGKALTCKTISCAEHPKRQLRLVQAWVELHAEELNADWELAADEKPLNPIAPLR